LELSLRSVIALLLLGTLLTGGCDRQSPPAGQANQTAPANTAAPAGLDRTHKGEAAPATAFQGPDGASVTLAKFQGKPLLLNLWATWCAPCVKEMPALDALSGMLGDKVQVLAVSQDTQDTEKVAPYLQNAGIKRLQPYLDTKAALSLGMGLNLPTTILYDSTGHEVWRTTGDMDWTGDAARALIAEAS
jgi:thiol-disulfide isomerase/thioredoxin